MDTPEKKEEEVKPIGVYGPNDKPKGKATVLPDDPIDVFPVDNGEVDKPSTAENN